MNPAPCAPVLRCTRVTVARGVLALRFRAYGLTEPRVHIWIDRARQWKQPVREGFASYPVTGP